MKKHSNNVYRTEPLIMKKANEIRVYYLNKLLLQTSKKHLQNVNRIGQRRCYLGECASPYPKEEVPQRAGLLRRSASVNKRLRSGHFDHNGDWRISTDRACYVTDELCTKFSLSVREAPTPVSLCQFSGGDPALARQT